MFMNSINAAEDISSESSSDSDENGGLTVMVCRNHYTIKGTWKAVPPGSL